MPPDAIDGILLLYRNFGGTASTVQDHAQAFDQYCRAPVLSVNTAYGFSAALSRLRFRVVVIHYSVFGEEFLPPKYEAYLRACTSSHKVVYFQDEYRFWRERMDFIRRHRIGCVYTMLEPAQFAETFHRHVDVAQIVTNLPGYVSADMERASGRFWMPDAERTVDIAYRGRQLPVWMGRAAQEKHEIAHEFGSRAQGRGLTLDLASREEERLYGDDWYRFLARARGVLGVESGTSIFDLDGVVEDAYRERLAKGASVRYEDMPQDLMRAREDRIYYRTISPRHFEAAALRNCQILYEGSYSSILQPDVHYIALRKDYSNLEEVLAKFTDPDVRRRLTERANRDLIASREFTYERMIQGFEADLKRAGIELEPREARPDARFARIRAGEAMRRAIVTAMVRLEDDSPLGRRVGRPIARLARSARARLRRNRK